MKLAGVDLNLLVALDAVFSERNVTRAAAQIGRSQPATSHALNRARALFGDQLLVRAGGTLELTVRGRALAPQVRRLMRELGSMFDAQHVFDPLALDTITIGATDYVGFVLLPQVFRLLQAVAPQLSVRVRNVEGADPLAPVSSGVLDVAIGTFPRVPAILRTEVLFEDRFVCLRRKTRAQRARLTPERFAALGHVLVASPDAGKGPVDYALAQRGLTRRVLATVPHFLVAPGIVHSTDLVLTTGQRVADEFAPRLQLESFPCPVPLEPFTVSMVWHARSDDEGAGRWLRELLREATAQLPPLKQTRTRKA
jgi:DNA-binding transcriptional LysR family regulator